jgi:hypothetical protein
MLYFEIEQRISLGTIISQNGPRIVLVATDRPPPVIKQLSGGYTVDKCEISEPISAAKMDFYFIDLTLPIEYSGLPEVQATRFGFYLKADEFDTSDDRVDVWTQHPFHIPAGLTVIQGRGIPFDFICKSCERLTFTHYVLRGTR